MKQSLKYYILIVLAMLLHSVTVKAANTSYIIEDPDQNECFISQAAPTNRNILGRFHFCCTIVPCEMGRTDISHVPTDKSFIRPETVFHKYRMGDNPLSDHSICSHTYNPSDLLAYYVYGLRKIIIQESYKLRTAIPFVDRFTHVLRLSTLSRSVVTQRRDDLLHLSDYSI